MQSSFRATLSGFSAILMWSLLAVLTAMSGAVPPFQLTAISFTIGGLLGFIWVALTGQWHALWQSWPVWVVSVSGLFGYHFFYFTALRNAPPVEASLIAYLWPLLIVVFSALLPGERVRWFHIAGAFMGLVGTAFVIISLENMVIDVRYGFGYIMAFLCALIWSGYSVLSRRFSFVPSVFIAAVCLVTAALSTISHIFLEETVWPTSFQVWFAVVGLGLFPVGLAFYVWDQGVKHGHIQIIGVVSYVAPLLSTVFLVVTGFAEPTFKIFLASILIMGGAMVASQDLFWTRQNQD